jgi:1-aminocyclopropane-1-carboxylate deaminase/D-cysteine desulfhydrase-like pyridoxal-dependent ACC family enzyme
MSNSNEISARMPILGKRLRKESLASLPTPVRSVELKHATGNRIINIKCDDLSGGIYGGNKVRKLEYALRPARERKKLNIATFGAVGSNHALATTLYARSLGYGCTCFLSHQSRTPGIAKTLKLLIANGADIVRFGGAYSRRIGVLREHMWNKDFWLIPAGGSSWLGTMGFVNAGLELATQIGKGELLQPDRIYMATGTMGSAAGLAIGLAIAGLPCQVEAVRVSVTDICNEHHLRRLIAKTIAMMHRLDASVSPDLERKVNIRLRHSFFADGYARSNRETDDAVKFASDELGLTLETTYTGKAMAALVRDLPENRDERVMFWNTYNSAPLPAPAGDLQTERLPRQFQKYL